MNPAVAAMLRKYERRSVDDHVNALREIFQEIALCGLWRGKFFERAAFYGGTALRVLYGLDRFSEDMDFSLLTPDPHFDLGPYCAMMMRELRAWGFSTRVEKKEKSAESAVGSAFLKANTAEQLLLIEAGEEIAGAIHRGQNLRIKVEVDTDPPPGFSTEAKFLLLPVPFSVRVFDLPSLFAGKMHALLCRGWKTRVKGRDWYDLVWYASRGTELDLAHLEARMRQSGHYKGNDSLDEGTFRPLLAEKIDRLDVARARADVERFLVDPSSVEIWSREFFHAVGEKIAVR
ncbi:MAG: nucleotidyl transferase AbiEii/AbiGii toxin family protein [Deferrisomatales bacterium]|nr:nucleotidyl transferase AbiEii/AbiGii toxin family protein [Deferrisomatales bacterium]